MKNCDIKVYFKNNSHFFKFYDFIRNIKNISWISNKKFDFHKFSKK